MISNYASTNSKELGKCAIQLRNEFNKNFIQPSNLASWFSCNSFYDSWFRNSNIHRQAYGYGLKIRSITITGKTKLEYGYGYVIKGSMERENTNGEPESNKIWIYIEDGENIDELIKYINENKESWID